MLTATLFKSEYRDAQGEWHHSRHDRRSPMTPGTTFDDVAKRPDKSIPVDEGADWSICR